jgi:hypothetical protein
MYAVVGHELLAAPDKKLDKGAHIGLFLSGPITYLNFESSVDLLRVPDSTFCTEPGGCCLSIMSIPTRRPRVCTLAVLDGALLCPVFDIHSLESVVDLFVPVAEGHNCPLRNADKVQRDALPDPETR